MTQIQCSKMTMEYYLPCVSLTFKYVITDWDYYCNCFSN